MKKTIKIKVFFILLIIATNFTNAQTLKEIRSSLAQINKQMHEVSDAISYFAKKDNRDQRKLIANRINREARILSDKSNNCFDLINYYMNSKNSKGIDRKKIEIMKSNTHFIGVKARAIEREAKKAIKDPSEMGYNRMKKSFLDMIDNYKKLKNAYNNIVDPNVLYD